MKKKVFFLSLIIISSCSKNNNCDSDEKTRKIETKNILKVCIDDSTKSTISICSTLKKLVIRTDLNAHMTTDSVVTVKFPPEENLISRNTEIFIEKLLEAKSIFSQKDSLNFVKQNDCFSSYHIPAKIFKNAKIVSLASLEDKNAGDNYIIISIPIFSNNNKKAYIEFDTYSKEYSHGESVFLEKTGEKWKIVHVQRNWSAD